MFDTLDAVTYQDNGVEYGTTPATRIRRIPSTTSNVSMVKESEIITPGYFSSIFGNGQLLPGPRYIESSRRFNGRPAWFTDKILDFSFYFDNIHSAMFPNLANGQDLNFFGLTQPWWCALVCRFSDVTDGGHEGVVMDGNPGVATISPKIVSGDGVTGTWGNIQAECWDNGLAIGGTIESDHAANPNRTYLIIYQVNTTNSRLITMYRDSTGVLQTSDKTGTGCSSGRAGAQVHIGWSNSQYVTAQAWKNGIITPTEIANLKKWAGFWIPPESTLPHEPLA